MTDSIEVCVTADSSGTAWTASVWNARTGTNLMSYKGGGNASANTVDFINNEFLVSANNTKPLLHVWPLNSQEQLSGHRFVTPGRVSTLAISPDGTFLVAAVAEMVYVWQISSGAMLAAFSKHYQTVNKIKFTDDGSHFVTAGADAMILVWNIGNVVGRSSNDQPEPLYSFSDHALSVTDICMGKGGLKVLLASVSLDRTCKIYHLETGKLLLSLVFQSPLSCVTMNHFETSVFVGSSNGSIYTFDIQKPPRLREHHLEQEVNSNQFIEHKEMVTCLSVSLDEVTLLSGSKDGNVLLWNIPSRQLIRTLPHKGSVTNGFFMITPKVMFDAQIKLSLVIGTLQRMIEKNHQKKATEILVTQPVRLNLKRPNKSQGSYATTLPDTQELEKLQSEVQMLRRANKDFFEYSVKHILENGAV